MRKLGSAFAATLHAMPDFILVTATEMKWSRLSGVIGKTCMCVPVAEE